MTGYGVASRAWANGPDGASMEVEARSVNARYREVKIRQPFGAAAEQLIRKRVEMHLGRGRIDVVIHIRRDRSADTGLSIYGVEVGAVEAAAAAAAEVRRVATQVSLELRPSSPMELLRFASAPRNLGETRVEPPPFFEEVVNEALEALVDMREKEGAELEKALAKLSDELDQTVAGLDPLLAGEPGRLAAVVRERLQAIVDGTGLVAPERERIAQEVAALVLRGDVAEERVRIRAHLARLRDILGAPARKGQGKTLDFLCQELFREIATIGSKISSHEGSAIVIDAKAILERLREQVQNVE